MRHINAGTIRIGNATPEYIPVPDLSKGEADVVPFHEDPVCRISDECSGSCVCSPFDHRACVRRAAVPGPASSDCDSVSVIDHSRL
ncbi:putative secreted protein [Granulibacter bethesdensis]|nr:putative secreted protein [Granulibacter bethesdensis]